MRNSLLLPIESRRSTILLAVPTLLAEEPVEAPAKLVPSDSPRPSDDDSERNVELEISRASVNAEMNRCMSLDTDGSSDSGASPKIHRNRRENLSVKFGNESDMEYVEGDGFREYTKTVRTSKEFDGNRSGRPSLKQ